ncbi:hypothetical protein [Klebsiella sp. BIGb0407]|uniref:hypothetical protein n=1 Tax=Klebsiella sp. BIGb0407 TaxID=2940603 RepID=UPI0021680B67|nr:hypothetical protein [Klebsiella sp. BIGb0407]MCS3432659.1 hypothetical protein [Klebsiella sp. BIGb0407]
MKKNTTLALICASLFLVQGCANVKKTDDSANKSKPVQNNQPVQASQPVQTAQLTALQRCLNDAGTLIKLDKKYQKNYNELYILINDAKLYASLSSETSENVKATIAPLFEYEINNKCNDISQQLIDAFKYKIKQNSMINGNS